MSINPKSLKEVIKLKFDDFFYYFQNDKPYKVSTKKITEYITDNVLGVLPPVLDKHSQITLDDGTNPHGTTKSDVGLGNVDNTSDADKPISSATSLEFVNVYNEISTKANNYVDIADIISGYTLLSTDAGKLITNSGVNVRSLNIPSGLALPNNVVFVKGRVSITPASGVTVELPDGSTITNSSQFACLANTQYVLHRKEFGGDEWILLDLSSKLSNVVEDTTPQLGGNLDLNGNDINGTGNVDVTGNVIADIVQLRGGVGTQGEMSWSADEETVQLIMDGTTLFLGQDTFVHVRNNTESIITKGTAVYATGTLGASGRITVAPMIADGTIAGRLFIGLTAEDIAIGADGQVCSYGKIRGVNTTAYTDGDVLWLSPTVAGQLTTTEPTAPNLKIATAFVIHTATNGTLFVRAEQGNDLHSDQRVQVSGLTNGDVLTWSNANQRWENEAPTGGGGGHEIYNGTDVTPLPERAGLRFKGYLEAVDDAGNDESVVDLSSTAITPAEITRFGENGSGNVDLKIAENRLPTGDANGFAIEYTASAECVIGLDINNEILEFEVIEIYNILKEEGVIADKTLALTDIAGASSNVKAKFEISAIAVENTTANAVTINIGSTALGTDVVNAFALGASETKKLPLGTTFFSTTTGQNLFISSGSWNSANINIHVTISKIWQ